MTTPSLLPEICEALRKRGWYASDGAGGSDGTNRLRSFIPDALCHSAAAELERLEAELVAVRAALADSESLFERLQDGEGTLRAEVGALRGALTGLYDATSGSFYDDVTYYNSDAVVAARSVAAGVVVKDGDT